MRRCIGLLAALLFASSASAVTDQILPSPHVNAAGQLYYPGNPNVVIPPTFLQVPSVHNEWPDPQMQLPLMGVGLGPTMADLTPAELPDLSGPVPTLNIQSFSWIAAYNTGFNSGSVQVTIGSTAVTGTGTSFTSNIVVGDWFIVPSQPQSGGYAHYYGVCAVPSNTSLTLCNPYAEGTTSGTGWYTTGYFSRGGNQRIVTAYSSNTGTLRAGDLVVITGGSSYFTKFPMRVLSVTVNASFTFRPEYSNDHAGVDMPANSDMADTATYQIMRPGTRLSGNLDPVSNQVFRLGNGSSSPNVVIESNPVFTGLFHGMTRVAIVQKTTSGPEYIYHEVSANIAPIYAGQWISTGMAVDIPTNANGATQVGNGSSATAFVYDGTSFGYGNVLSTVDGLRHWTGASYKLSSSATDMKAGIRLLGPAGSVFIIAEFFETKGYGYTQDGVFSTPTDQRIEAQMGVLPFNNAASVNVSMVSPATVDALGAGSYGVIVDFEQRSFGIIGPGVSDFEHAHFEGQTNAGGACAGEGFRSYMTTPTKDGVVAYQPQPQALGTPGAYASTNGFLPIGNAGGIWSTNCPSTPWEDVDLEAESYILWSTTSAEAGGYYQ